MSTKYQIIKKAFRIFHVNKIMQSEPEKMKKFFAKMNKGIIIPDLHDDELDFSVNSYLGSPVLMVKHKKPCTRACVYLVGGGMMKYPKASQAEQMVSYAKETGRDMILPYFPLAYDHALPDVYDMLYEMYKDLLHTYAAEDITIFGGSSGAFHALTLVSFINEKGEGIPVPGRICAISPGSAYSTQQEYEKAKELDEKDLIMSTKALEKVFEVMVQGKELPEYMIYMQRGNYKGLKDVFLCFGGDEVFCACAEGIKNRLEEYGAHVTLEIGEGLYHVYPCFPIVKEAEEGNRKMMKYLSE